MKFDSQKAIEQSRLLASLDLASEEGERKAAQVVNAQFQSAGLCVEWLEGLGSRFHRHVGPWLGWVATALCLTWMVIETERGSAWIVRYAATCVAMLVWSVTGVYGFRFGWILPPRVLRRSVIGGKVSSQAEPVRVVFAAPLGVVTPVRWGAPRWISGPLVGLLALVLLFDSLSVDLGGWFEVPRLVRLSVLGVFWLAAVCRAWWESRTPPGHGCAENSSGLAVLLELARTWSKVYDDRIETRFVATGGQSDDFAGLRALVYGVERQWPYKPTLVILLLAPAVGNGLIVASRRLNKLAKEAASDLWIPHLALPDVSLLAYVWPSVCQCKDSVCLLGDQVLNRDRNPEIAPDALGRAAQLATEIALRWAKRGALQVESVARSSQKPG